jgi:hypothetical protein
MLSGAWSLILLITHLLFVVSLAWLNGRLLERRGAAARRQIVFYHPSGVEKRLDGRRPRGMSAGPDGLSQFDGHILEAARLHKVDPNLVRAIILAESGGDPLAVSPRNARGLMQVLPSTGRDLGVPRADELFDPRTNIFLGTRYLSQLLVEFNGDLPRALAAYNAGPRLVYEGRPLPAETRAYVPRVVRLWAQLRRTGRSSLS